MSGFKSADPTGTGRKIVLCTGCKDWNRCLKEAYPTWMASGYNDIVIVDWSSSEPVEDAISGMRGNGTHVIRVDGQDKYRIAAARNTAAIYACRRMSADYLLVIDPDVKLPCPLPGYMFVRNRVCTGRRHTMGTATMPASLYMGSRGYNETIALGDSDEWFYKGLDMRGAVAMIGILTPHLDHIDHSRNGIKGDTCESKEALSRRMKWIRYGRHSPVEATVSMPDGTSEHTII